MSNEAIDISKLTVNTIKCLSIDAVEKANSGHPGMPMGCADMAYVLWQEFLTFDPKEPLHEARDRFILSAGHGSMLQYSLLHLYGYDLSMQDIQNFRQLNSKTPGHPEFGHTQGVEVSTGPLGQGFANGVGMAIAAKKRQSTFSNKHVPNIYGIVSDGDLMEGISYEAASLAGHLALDNLIYLYDSNQISIDGSTDITFNENIEQRFASQNWFVQNIDGHKHDDIRKALKAAKNQSSQPSIIICNTNIANGAPNKQGTSASHGAPLGADEIKAFKNNIGWQNPDFFVPESVYEHCKTSIENKRDQLKNIEAIDANQLKQFRNKQFNFDFEWPQTDKEATRNISAQILNQLAKDNLNIITGSADLAGSTKAIVKESNYISKNDFSATNIAYGIREHAMASIANGLALYDAYVPVVSTFLVFSDYLKPALRLSALSKLQVIYVFTHDSIFVGEDGPTHQPIEHINALRCIPNVKVYRPGTVAECMDAWKQALNNTQGPSVLCMSRQKFKLLDELQKNKKHLSAGNVLIQNKNTASKNDKKIRIVASGSELDLAEQVYQNIQSMFSQASLISIPCLEEYSQLDQKQKDALLPQDECNVLIEATQTDAWHKHLSRPNICIDMNDFGLSGPGNELAKHFGFDVDSICQKIKQTFL